jgi:hypothetical protein
MQIANFKANGELITSAGSGGGAPTDATYITQTANGSLSAEQALASLSTGLMKVTTTTGVVSSVTDSAGLAGCLSDETGSGAAVFGTSPTLTTPRVATAINDANGNEIIKTPATASAVNEITVTNAAAGSGVTVSTTGDDTDIDLLLVAKGAGVVKADGVEVVTLSGTQTLTNKTLTTPRIGTSINDTNGNEIISLTATGSAVNQIGVTNAAAAGTPQISAVGDDTDISIDYNAKGAGRHIFEQNIDLNDKSLLKALYTDLKAAAAPSNPSAGYIRVYADSGNSNHVTQRDSAGTVIDLAAGGGSGVSTIKEDGSNVVTSADTIDFKDFNVEDLTGGDAAVYHNLPGICGGRLTLTTGVPVTTADVTAAGTLYFTPYKGNKISLYDGTRWKVYTFSEVSLSLTLTSGNMYDVWLYDNAGTLTLETLIWTNATTRATALATQDGVYLKTGALTRRYLGSLYASGTNTAEDSAARRLLYNYYNRVDRWALGTITDDSWTYTTATYRAANTNTTNGQGRVEIVQGVAEDAIHARVIVVSSNGSGGLANPGIGISSTSSNSSQIRTLSGVAMLTTTHAEYLGTPGIGYYYIQWLEQSQAVGTTTWYGDAGSTIQSGLMVRGRF